MGRQAKLWGADAGERVTTLADLDHDVYPVVSSSDNTSMLTASVDSTARLWSAAPPERAR